MKIVNPVIFSLQYENGDYLYLTRYLVSNFDYEAPYGTLIYELAYAQKSGPNNYNMVNSQYFDDLTIATLAYFARAQMENPAKYIGRPKSARDFFLSK